MTLSQLSDKIGSTYSRRKTYGVCDMETVKFIVITLGVTTISVFVGCASMLLGVMPHDSTVNHGWMYVWSGLVLGAIIGGIGLWLGRRRSKRA